MKNSLFVLLIFWSDQSQDPVWEKTSNSDGIETKIGTDPKTDFPIFESQVTIDADIETVHKLLMDHDKLQEMVYGVSDSRRLPDAEDRVLVYYRLDLPWPVRDKYAVTEESYTLSDNRIDILIESVEYEYTPEDDLSKIDMLHTDWELYRIDDSTTKVIYRSMADPMGIPNWVVKLFLSTSPKETLRNLRERAELAD